MSPHNATLAPLSQQLRSCVALMNSNTQIPVLFKMPEALMTAATGPNHPTTNPTAWLAPPPSREDIAWKLKRASNTAPGADGVE